MPEPTPWPNACASAHYRPTKIVASLEPKATQTGSIIAEATATAVRDAEGLHEHDRRASGFLSTEVFAARMRDLFAQPDAVVFGNESASDALARFAKAVDQVVSEVTGDVVDRESRDRDVVVRRITRARERVGAVGGARPSLVCVARAAESSDRRGRPHDLVHADEVATDASLVRRLLAAQFPEWADLAIERVPSAGTDNAIYRLGDDMAVRLPRIDWATGQVEREHRWLPRARPAPPARHPDPARDREHPAEGYPWHWSVYRWLEGENATADRIAICAKRRPIWRGSSPPCSGSIRPAGRSRARNGPAACHWQRETRRLAPRSPHCTATLDTEAATAEWEAALRAPVWPGPACGSTEI